MIVLTTTYALILLNFFESFKLVVDASLCIVGLFLFKIINFLLSTIKLYLVSKTKKSL